MVFKAKQGYVRAKMEQVFAENKSTIEEKNYKQANIPVSISQLQY